MSRQPRPHATSRVVPFRPDGSDAGDASESAPLLGGGPAPPASECSDDRPWRPDADTPGQALQHERERCGISLDDLARTTKISKTILHAIETTDRAHLPAPIYTRGFVKVYASELGLDPQRTSDSYMRHLQPVSAEKDDAPHTSAREAHTAALEAYDVRDFFADDRVRRLGRFLTVVGAAAVLVYVVSVNRGDLSNGAGSDRDDAVDAGAGLALASSALGEEALAFEPAPGVANAPLRVVLTTRADCWVLARVDGERALMKLLPAGARESLEIGEELVLRVGEPGALVLSINGEPARALGPAGQPITVRITRENFRDFLGS